MHAPKCARAITVNIGSLGNAVQPIKLEDLYANLYSSVLINEIFLNSLLLDLDYVRCPPYKSLLL